MPPTKTARWKIALGYAAFSLLALLFSFFITFPYDALKQRIQSEADGVGLYVKLGALGPGFLGVTATDVHLSQKVAPGDEKPPKALALEWVTVRPSLSPLGVSVSADALGGSVKVKVGGLTRTVVEVTLDELNLANPQVKDFTGVDMAGVVDGRFGLTIPRTATAPGRPAEPDLGQASGSLSLALSGVTVKGGTVHVPIPPYPDPTPVDLPRIALGSVEGKVGFDKGTGTIESFSSKGDHVELKATGTLKLAKRFEYTEPNVEVRLCLSEEFKKNLGMVSMGLSALAGDPKDPKCRIGRLTGYLGRPNFR